MNLMGLDIGFSKTNDSTGIACWNEGRLYTGRACTDWESRRKVLPAGFRPDVIAVDGPIVPAELNDTTLLVRRSCEVTFSRGIFMKRCKPGLSDFGTGLQLRIATAKTMPHLQALGQPQIVEAFPNLFLGVLLPDEVYQTMPALARGKRFDWLYDKVASNYEILQKLLIRAWLPFDISFREEKDHEIRAALVCLVLAGLTAHGNIEQIGDATGGWFTMPPFDLWQPWALRGLQQNTPQHNINFFEEEV